MLIEGITRFCFAASYAVALGLEGARLARPSNVLAWVARGFALAGIFAHTVYLLAHVPSPAAPAGSLLMLAWVLAVFHLYGALHHRRVSWSLFTLPVVLACVGLAEAALRWGTGDYGTINGARLWGTVHGTLLLGAAVGVSVAAVASAMYLIQAARLKRKANPIGGLRMLSLEKLEGMNRRAVNLAFPLLTAGLLLGLLLTRTLEQPATEWRSLKVASTVGLWLAFLLLVVLRYGVHLPGRRLAGWTLLAFALMLVSLAAAHPYVAGAGVR